MIDIPVGIEEEIQPELEEIVSRFECWSISPAPRPPITKASETSDPFTLPFLLSFL